MKPKQKNTSMLLFMGGLIYLLLILLSLHMGRIAEDTGNTNLINLLSGAMSSLSENFFGFLPLAKSSIKYCGIMTAIAAFFGFYVYLEDYKNKQDAPGKEEGSAAWFKNFKQWNKDFVEPTAPGEMDMNIILADKLKLSMNNFKTNMTLNTVVIGGTGTGKSRYVIKPNMLQFNASFVVTDPSGGLFMDEARPLQEQGYDVSCLNLVNMEKSNCYNPFDYIRRDKEGNYIEESVADMVTTLMQNTSDPSAKGGDQFWVDSTKALLLAICFYLIEFRPSRDRNFSSVLKLVRSGKMNDNNTSSKSALDRIFSEAAAKNEKSLAVTNYNTFKLAGANTAQSILISTAVRINGFDIPRVAKLSSTDFEHPENNINISTIGDKKTAIFLILPTKDSQSFSFLASMFYSQLFDVLYYKAENLCPSRYHIYDNHHVPVLTMFESKKEASDMLSKLQASTIKLDPTYESVYHLQQISDGSLLTTSVSVEVKKGFKKKKTIEKVLEFEARETAMQYLEDNGIVTCIIKKEKKQIDKYFLFDENGEKILSKKEEIIPSVREVVPDYDTRKPYSFDTLEKANFFIKSLNGATISSSGQALPWAVRCMLDEFANIGTIPNFVNILSTVRKYNISATIILQSLSQIKKMYDKDWPTIMSNCDIQIFLGSQDTDTCEHFSKVLGKATIRIRSTGISKGGKSSSSMNYNRKGRNLMDVNELTQLKKNECVILLRAQHPFLMKKYPLEKHPNYKLSGDGDKSKKLTEDYINKHFGIKANSASSSSSEVYCSSSEKKMHDAIEAQMSSQNKAKTELTPTMAEAVENVPVSYMPESIDEVAAISEVPVSEIDNIKSVPMPFGDNLESGNKSSSSLVKEFTNLSKLKVPKIEDGTAIWNFIATQK